MWPISRARARSSAGQSRGLIIPWTQVRILARPFVLPCNTSISQAAPPRLQGVNQSVIIVRDGSALRADVGAGIYRRRGRYSVAYTDPSGRRRKRTAATMAEARALKAALADRCRPRRLPRAVRRPLRRVHPRLDRQLPGPHRARHPSHDPRGLPPGPRERGHPLLRPPAAGRHPAPRHPRLRHPSGRPRPRAGDRPHGRRAGAGPLRHRGRGRPHPQQPVRRRPPRRPPAARRGAARRQAGSRPRSSSPASSTRPPSSGASWCASSPRPASASAS